MKDGSRQHINRLQNYIHSFYNPYTHIILITSCYRWILHDRAKSAQATNHRFEHQFDEGRRRRSGRQAPVGMAEYGP